MLLFPLRGSVTLIERVQRWLFNPTPMKACSQLLLQVHIFLVRWLNFSAQGSALDPFFCTPSLDALTQSCSCGHQPRADDPAPQVPDISAHCLLDMPAGISNLGRKFQSATPLPQVFPISRNDTAFQTPQIILHCSFPLSPLPIHELCFQNIS